MTAPRTRTLTTILLWLAIGAAYLYPLFLFPINNPNERVRIYMTAAMVEHNTFAIGYREAKGRAFTDEGSVYGRWGYVNDKALVCDDPALSPPDCEGTLYSAKAPGISFLGYPFYALLHGAAKVFDRELSMDVIIYYLRLCVVVLPALLMLVLFRRFGRANGLDPVMTDLVTLGMAVGSMVYTYSHMFAGHQVTTFFLFLAFIGAWHTGQDERLRWPLLAGFAAAAAVGTEYPMALVAFVLFLYLLRNRFTWRTFVAYGVGALLPVLLTAWYHWSAFGSPLATPYSFLENPQFIADIAPGIMGMRAPRLLNLHDAFVAPYEGLFFYAPWMVLMIPAVVLYAFRSFRHDSRTLRRSFPVHFGAVLALTLFIACHSLWRGGWTLGPRYIVPVVPFGAFVVLLGLDRLTRRFPIATRTVTAALVFLSVFVTGACSMVSQGFNTVFYNPITEVVWPLFAEDYVTHTMGDFLGLSGLAGLVPLAILGLPAVLCLAWRASSEAANRLEFRVLSVALMILIAVAGFRLLVLPQQPMNHRKFKSLGWLKRNFYTLETRNQAQNQHALYYETSRAFPNNETLQLLRNNDLTLYGRCDESLTHFRKWAKAERRATQARAYATILQAPIPVPGPLVVPVGLRPDFQIPAHELRRLAREQNR